MNALEQEVIEKFLQFDQAGRQRVFVVIQGLFKANSMQIQ